MAWEDFMKFIHCGSFKSLKNEIAYLLWQSSVKKLPEVPLDYVIFINHNEIAFGGSHINMY